MSFNTERVHLRRFIPEDLAPVHGIESDPEVMVHTGPGRAQTLEESKVRFQKLLDPKLNFSVFGFWAGIDKVNGELFAWFMLLEGENASAELGYMLSKNYWGRGFATEIATALCEKAFAQTQLNKIVANVSPLNQSSANILLKLGFNFEKADLNLDRYTLSAESFGLSKKKNNKE